MLGPRWAVILFEVSCFDPSAKEPTQWKFSFTFMNNSYKQQHFCLGISTVKFAALLKGLQGFYSIVLRCAEKCFILSVVSPSADCGFNITQCAVKIHEFIPCADVLEDHSIGRSVLKTVASKTCWHSLG